MKQGQNNNDNTFVSVVLAAFALLALKSIFENDNSKILSKKGRRLLSDEKKMESINSKIEEQEKKSQYGEIII